MSFSLQTWYKWEGGSVMSQITCVCKNVSPKDMDKTRHQSQCENQTRDSGLLAKIQRV